MCGCVFGFLDLLDLCVRTCQGIGTPGKSPYLHTHLCVFGFCIQRESFTHVCIDPWQSKTFKNKPLNHSQPHLRLEFLDASAQGLSRVSELKGPGTFRSACDGRNSSKKKGNKSEGQAKTCEH